jgi:hypothetical protein
MNKHRLLHLSTALAMLITAVLACAGTPDSLRIDGLPQYICPSATPRPTDTPRPTSPPTYPFTFLANLDYTYVDTTRSLVNVRYLAQSVGSIQLAYSGTTSSGQPWLGSGGVLNIGYAPYGAPGITGNYPLFIPSAVTTVTLTIFGGGTTYAFTVTRYFYPLSGNSNPYPCCLTPPIYPTPVPTYTPYPTPTPYVRTNDYFVGDPIYALTSTLRIRLKVTDISSVPTNALDRSGDSQHIYVWHLEIKNIGQTEYDLFPAIQMYVSEIVTAGGGTLEGVWGPSLTAAKMAGITATYDPAVLAPGQIQTFALAAYGPAGTAYRVSYALDLTTRGSGPTQVPGAHIVSWLNAVNTVCKGEIQEP